MSNETDPEALSCHHEVLTTDTLYTRAEICRICQLDESGLQDYLDYGIVVYDASVRVHFRQPELDRLLRARRLQVDLEINHAGVALALDLLDTIDELKREIAMVRGGNP